MDGMRGYGYRSPQWGAPEEEPGGRRAKESRRGFRWFAGTVVVTFAVALAVVIGQRLSDQAISILAGAVCGVGASIPTSLMIVWVTRRREETRSREPERPTSGMYPPVVVVQPPPQMGYGPAQGSGQLSPYGMQHPGAMPPSMREFTVVGDGMEQRSERYRWHG